MAQLEPFAAVLGNTPASDSMFLVRALGSISVSEWKELVHNKGPKTITDYKPADLILWKLDKAIPSDQVDTEVAALAASQNLSEVAVKMLPTKKLSRYFPLTPMDDSLHVIVELPSLHIIVQPPRMDEQAASGSKRKAPELGTSSADSETLPDKKKQKVQPKPRMSDPTDGLYSRPETVAILYKMLSDHKFIFVRGTPASGKTSLALLLRKYINDNHSEKVTCFLSRYRDEPVQKPIMGWREWLKVQEWTFPPNGVLIIDEAQLSYWDDSFWLEFIQSINANTPYMVILFASYGSAGRNLLNDSTPLVVQEGQLVGLDHNLTEASVGLLLTREEMEGVVTKSFRNHHFDVSLLNYVYSLTSGHVGACYDTLRVIEKHQSYRGNNGEYTYDDWILSFEMSTFLQQLSDQGVFSRGLPTRDDLEDPKKSFVKDLRDVLKSYPFCVLLEKEFDQRGSKHPLRRCLEQGWLFSEPADRGKVLYRFASQLHQLYTGWLLL